MNVIGAACQLVTYYCRVPQIQTTGDGDPVLPLSGIASPELVHAICASPLNLHFKVSLGLPGAGTDHLCQPPHPALQGQSEPHVVVVVPPGAGLGSRLSRWAPEGSVAGDQEGHHVVLEHIRGLCVNSAEDPDAGPHREGQRSSTCHGVSASSRHARQSAAGQRRSAAGAAFRRGYTRFGAATAPKQTSKT